MPLANVTLGANAATVTFSSISQSYRDLVLVINANNTSGGSALWLRFNGDSGSNYQSVVTAGYDSTLGSSSTSGPAAYLTFFNAMNTTRGAFAIANIMEYSTSDKQKPILSRLGLTNNQETNMIASRWANTAAITSVSIPSQNGEFVAGSTFALYGVAA